MTNRIYTFFEELDTVGIDLMIETHYPESLYLEFKTSARPDPDNRQIAKMFSGFANSAGGVIVWGMETVRDNSSQRDVAHQRRRIPQVARFVERLDRLSVIALTPPLDGIQNRVVEVDDDGAGTAATYVPESITGPHMALMGHDRYFKRSEVEFYPMQHYDVADMFGSRQRPSLRLTRASLTEGGSGYDPRANDAYKEVRIAIALVNAGRASAMASYVRVVVPPVFSATPGSVSSREFGSELRFVSDGTDPHAVAMIGSKDFVLHPGMSVHVATVTAHLLAGDDAPVCHITYATAAMNSPLEHYDLTIEAEEIAQALSRGVAGVSRDRRLP
jgi:hypothetical protein